MSLFESITKRNLENPQIPITSPKILELLGVKSSSTGKKVTIGTAMSNGAVFRSVAIISGTGGSLPFKAYHDDTHRETVASVLDDPHPDLPPQEFWSLVIAQMATWGNHYSLKRKSLGAGNTKQLWPVYPDRVSVSRAVPTKANPTGKVFKIYGGDRAEDGQLAGPADRDPGNYVVLTPEEMFHVPAFNLDGLVGISPIQAAREAIASGLSAEEYSNKLWASGIMASGILQTEQRLDEEKATAIKSRWQDRVGGLERAHEIAVIDQGLNFQQLSLPPQDAQFIESRRFSVTEIARFYGLPPYLLAETDRSTSWGTGIEIQGTGFLMYTLHPAYLSRIEGRATKELLKPGEFAEFSVQGLMRGDSKTRASFYETMFGIGALTVNEIRELENYAEIPVQDQMPPADPDRDPFADNTDDEEQ